MTTNPGGAEREDHRPDRATIETLCLLWLVAKEQRTPAEVTRALGLDAGLASGVAHAYQPLIARGLVRQGEGLAATPDGLDWLNAELERFGVVR